MEKSKRKHDPVLYTQMLTALSVIALLVVIWLASRVMSNAFEVAINQNTYQAVFLNNGQVYFGQMNPVGMKYLHLNDVYYIQENTQPADAEGEEQSELQVVKLGNEIHQPESAMTIPRESILYWENLTQDSEVLNSIAEYKKRYE